MQDELVLLYFRNVSPLLTSRICLTFYSPLYVNIVIIYSMANLHDISWGNRETDDSKGDETKKNLEVFRAKSVIVWILFNTVYGYLIILWASKGGGDEYLLIIVIVVSFTVILKVMVAFFVCLKSCLC